MCEVFSKNDFFNEAETALIRSKIIEKQLSPGDFKVEVVEDHGFRSDEPFMRKGIVLITNKSVGLNKKYVISETNSYVEMICSDISSLC